MLCGIFTTLFAVLFAVLVEKGIEMAYCPYCNRWFRNKQAVRAHLKHCPLKPSENRNFYSKLVEKAKEFEGRSVEKEEKLLLRFLNTVVSLDRLPEKLNATTVASLMGINPEIAKEFIKWLKKSDYYPIVKFTVDVKRREK